MSRRRPVRDWKARSLTWLCGGALALNLFLITCLLGLLSVNGMGYFWQRDLVLVALEDGGKALGEVHDREPASHEGVATGGSRILLKVGNRDLTGVDFRWIDEAAIQSTSRPADAMVLERLEWGNFYGWMTELRRGDEILATGPAEVSARFAELHPRKLEELERIRELETGEIGDVNYSLERLRLERRQLESAGSGEAGAAGALAEIGVQEAELQRRYEALAGRLFELRESFAAETVLLQDAAGASRRIPVGAIVRAVQPNAMGWPSKAGLYARRLAEFLLADPRESNTEGGIFPAIFGTVMMVFLMSIAVVPLGVLAALYLREYSKQGPLVRVVRIAVNNLAGVPSIVFGVFGLGFFVYLVGGTIDRVFYSEALPTPTYGTGGILWASLTLALLTVPVVIVATEEGLSAVPRVMREGSMALGATKFETTMRVVLPASAPGIMTGTILAMARAAGEVAPLMIVGMVKLAPSLPVDHHFPFVHLERKFMHLGFHIYDVGFQSPNVEATKPLVYATALLLVLLVTAMNLVAIGVRHHLRKQYASSVF